MERHCSFGLYCLFLPALLVCVSSGRERTEKDSLLTEVSSYVNMPSECVLSCTAHTYREMLEEKRSANCASLIPQAQVSWDNTVGPHR
uniref:Secreted protein n=1 Tax=Anguilla anguilla TaxID=7936 RepID=A0A0E9R1L6_ANGAN